MNDEILELGKEFRKLFLQNKIRINELEKTVKWQKEELRNYVDKTKCDLWEIIQEIK